MSHEKLTQVRGWTLLQRETDWKKWHGENLAFYPEPAPCFPCLVQERLTSDDNSTYEYLTEGMMSDMQAAVKANLL